MCVLFLSLFCMIVVLSDRNSLFVVYFVIMVGVLC